MLLGAQKKSRPQEGDKRTNLEKIKDKQGITARTSHRVATMKSGRVSGRGTV